MEQNQKKTINAIVHTTGIPIIDKIAIRLVVMDTVDGHHKAIFKRHHIFFWPVQQLARNFGPCTAFRGIMWFPNYGNLEKALIDLENAILICGYTQYTEMCEKIASLIIRVPGVENPEDNKDEQGTDQQKKEDNDNGNHTETGS